MLATLIVAAVAAPVVLPAPAPVTRAALSGPAERFAADVTGAVDRGGAVRLLEIGHGDAPVLRVVIADGHGARRYELAYTEDGSLPIEYRAFDVPVPAEPRIYGAADDFVRKLRAHAPGVLSEECGSYTLELGADTVWLDETNYYAVSASAAGDGADALLADALTRALAAGFELVELRGGALGDAPVIELVLGGDSWRVIHVVTDRRGKVALVEVRERPASLAYQTYRYRAELLSDLRVGRAFHSLALEPTADGGQRLVGVMRAGVRLTVEPGEFRHEEVGCGC